MKTKLVIFDNDGVVVDSEVLVKQALVAAFAAHGVTITPAWAYLNLQGLRASDAARTVEAYAGRKIDELACLEFYHSRLARLFDADLQPTRDIVPQLQRLRSMGVPFCIATSGALAETYHKFEITKLAPYFPYENIFSGEQVAQGKPAPDLMLLAASHMGIAPESCAVVEDAPSGIRAARAAGMYAIGYMGGAHGKVAGGLTAELLTEAGADIVIDDHNQLLDTIP